MKTIITFNVNHAIDIITNSSSELFVLQGKTKEIVEDMILNVYPEYKTEYAEICNITELSTDNFETYLSYVYRDWNDDTKLSLSKRFNIAPEILYSNYSKKDTEKYWWPILSDDGANQIKKIIDPNNEMYFLFSKDENPNWDMQEKLWSIGDRYHLG